MKFRKILKNKYFLITTGVLFFWFVVHMAVLLVIGFSSYKNKADAIVVLGNKIESGGVPSRRLKDRLNKALELFEAGRGKIIIVSGGKGKEGYWEATAMGRYLWGSGVPIDKIIIDNSGVNTRATAKFVSEYFNKHGYSSAIVVSQYYHIMRCKLALKQEGVSRLSGTAANFNPELRDSYCLFREFIGYYAYLTKLK